MAYFAGDGSYYQRYNPTIFELKDGRYEKVGQVLSDINISFIGAIALSGDGSHFAYEYDNYPYDRDAATARVYSIKENGLVQVGDPIKGQNFALSGDGSRMLLETQAMIQIIGIVVF